MVEEFLKMENISKSFGGCKALKKVNFSCNKGEVHILAGENGAGKSTILKILAGLFNSDEGDIYIKGEKVNISNPIRSQQLGIAMVFQELTLIGELSVLDNLFLNIEPKKNGLIDKKKMRSKALELMNKYGIDINLDSIVCKISVAQQQMVEILKILIHDPELIILDEPTSALAKKEVNKLFEIIHNLVNRGKTIIFISHRLEEVFEIGDRVTVFKDGESVGTRNVSEINNDELIKMMVGRSLQKVFPDKQKIDKTVALFEVNELNGAYLHDISFRIHPGEVFGIAGLQGHGQTELMNAISGLYPLKSGKMKIKDKEVKVSNAKQAIKNKIALVPSDRKTEGLMLGLSVAQNASLCSLNLRSKFGIISTKKDKEFVKATVNKLSIKAFNVNNPAASLSGGNQQKVVLGKEIAINPEVILFNDPTRGIDVLTKSEFYSIMNNLASGGTAVIMSSSDMMEVIGMCSRIAVMYEGSIISILEGNQISEENIMRCAMGIRIDDEDKCVGGTE